MDMTSYKPGTPSWVDLGTTDPDAAANFYGGLFGWAVAPAMPDSGGYRMAFLRDRPVAGIGPQPMPNVPPTWTTYVSVADADETAGTVTAAGGQAFMPPMDVFEFGRMAVFADPQGAAFAIWQPKQHAGAGLVGEPGTMTWNELLSTDLASSKAFYHDVFGWEPNDHAMPGAEYTQFELDGQPVAGLMAKPAEMPAEVPPYWGVYFGVANADSAVEWVRANSGNIVVPATDIPVGRFATMTDPLGALFSVVEMKIDPAMSEPA